MLPRLCIIAVAVMTALALIDLVPRMVFVATQPPETSYWEAWEEAYMNRCVAISCGCSNGSA
jgi:hypothetical protein